ncbi:hypothetical protein B0A52_04441 [Exophiala mesophila]|uniref:Cytochrome b5 heme-binding domain-containing protein n=1 Tax=Exophiala mesophila TaxID=212818 RepID=A0A438N8X6_EXOME|nr:hypothetical protein B0A52_04441 [Exophiala mesophila]
MGWITTVGGTLLVGYFVYKFLLQDTSNDPQRDSKDTFEALPSKSNHAQSQIVVSTTDAQAELDNSTIPEPPIKLNLPPSDYALEDEQGQQVSDRSVEEKVPKQIPGLQLPVMAPPPPPPPITNKTSSPPRLNPSASFGSMAAPPRPGNGFVRPPPSAAASLRVPPQKALLNTSMAPTSSIMPPGKQVSRKVILEPGHSPLDWAALTNDPTAQLRGKDAPPNLIRVTPAQLKHQNGRKGRDAWTVYHGKVYNITPYLPFHPGGVGEIMRGAGKDSVKLFMEVHPWVNWEGMLSECLVGIFVSEEDESSTDLDGMD